MKSRFSICINYAREALNEFTYHFIVYFMEVNFTDFIHYVFIFKRNKCKTWKSQKMKRN